MENSNDIQNKTNVGNEVLADVSGSYFDSKPLTEMEYLEYMSKKAKTVHTIIYPDGSKGELNRGVVVLL